MSDFSSEECNSDDEYSSEEELESEEDDNESNSSSEEEYFLSPEESESSSEEEEEEEDTESESSSAEEDTENESSSEEEEPSVYPRMPQNRTITHVSEDEDLNIALERSLSEFGQNNDDQLDQGISQIHLEDRTPLIESNDDVTTNEQGHCPVCFENRLEYAFTDCGHVVCGNCRPRLKNCPICRKVIRGAIRVYITK